MSLERELRLCQLRQRRALLEEVRVHAAENAAHPFEQGAVGELVGEEVRRLRGVPQPQVGDVPVGDRDILLGPGRADL